MNGTLLDYDQAARFLGIKLGTLYSLVSHQRIPHIRLGRRLVRFDEVELQTWINTHRVAMKGGAA